VDDSWNYSAKVSDEQPIYRQLDPSQLAQNINMITIDQPIKIILLAIPAQFYPIIYQELQLDETVSVITHTQEGNIDITAKGINKFTTLQNYFSTVEYIAFGNDNNDVELLVHAEKSYFIGSEDFANQLSLTSSQVLSKDNNQIAKLIEKLC
jgi:hydroxymethylpyrimidine pyrophosphatase-like HAD family hydrolase